MFETRKPAVLRTYFKYFEVAFWASTFELAVYLSAFSPPFSPITASVLLVKPTSNYEWHHKHLRKRCDLYYQRKRVTSRFDISIDKSL